MRLFFSCFFFFCLCPASAASVWVLTGIRNKHRMMIQTWIINTVSFLPELLLNNFVQMNPETPSSPDTDTGIWYPQNECLQFTTSYLHGDDHAHVFKNFHFSHGFVLCILCSFQEEGKIRVYQWKAVTFYVYVDLKCSSRSFAALNITGEEGESVKWVKARSLLFPACCSAAMRYTSLQLTHVLWHSVSHTLDSSVDWPWLIAARLYIKRRNQSVTFYPTNTMKRTLL